jgi:hypothetical protein
VTRVHCVDCGTDVVVDPLGHCPDGHLLPATGTRVSTAIGSHEPYPDEPVPWVGRVALDESEPEPVVERTAQAQAAPGLAPAEREPAPGDLLRELGDLGGDPAPDLPPAPSGASAGNGHAPATDAHAPGANGHGRTAPVGPTPSRAVPGHTAEAGLELSELSALEHAIQALDGSSTGTPAPPAGTPAGETGDVDDDLGRLFDDLDGLGHGTPADPAPTGPTADLPPPVATATPPPPPAPVADEPRWEALSDVAGLAAADADERSVPTPAAVASSGPEREAHRAGIDTMNFTARGGSTGSGRRRRLFGRSG